MERNFQLDWAEIVEEARRRRKERKLTQRHLAAIAGVSTPTVNRFERNREDVQLSSVFAILKQLGMIEQKQEGSLLLRIYDSPLPRGTAMFAPYGGTGAPLEARKFETLEQMQEFLTELGIADNAIKIAIGTLLKEGAATVSHMQLSRSQLRQYWPLQFPPAGSL